MQLRQDTFGVHEVEDKYTPDDHQQAQPVCIRVQEGSYILEDAIRLEA